MSGKTVILYVQVQRGDDWLDFVKGTPEELASEVL
jgi:hypothetical protein